MQVSVENVSKVERRLTIIVPANQLEQAYTEQIDRFAKQANIKGFRPGKAPLSYIKKRFGDDARKEALSVVIQKALREAITEHNLKPVSTPRVEPKLASLDQPLEFTASFEVLPELEKIEFSMDSIEKPVVDIKSDDIERVITQLLKQYTKWEEVKRDVQASDRVVIDYQCFFDDKEQTDNKIQDFTLEIGSKAMFPGFEEGLIGASVDEERTLDLIVPPDFEEKDKAGKPIKFVVRVKQIFEANYPEMNENFIKKMGINTGKEEDLKKQIQTSLEMERDRLLNEKLKDQIFTKLLEQNPIEVPNTLVSREVKNIHDGIYPPEQPHNHEHSEEEVNVFQGIAKKRVSLGILISEYAKQANLKIDKNRVIKRIQEIASAYENPQEVADYLSGTEQRSGIEAQVMEDEVLEKLMENIPVTEKIMSYAELKGIRI